MAYQIVKDAARFLRSPDRLEGELASRPQAVDYVVAFGQSQMAKSKPTQIVAVCFTPAMSGNLVIPRLPKCD
jgi:hypothetical protein